jgi:hypothetical protein
MNSNKKITKFKNILFLNWYCIEKYLSQFTKGVKKAPDPGSGFATLIYKLRINYAGIRTKEGKIKKKSRRILCLQNHK